MSISASPVQQVAGVTISGGSATKNITIAAPAAGNALRLLATSANVASISSVTGGGVTWALEAEYHDVPNSIHAYIYRGENSSGSGTSVGVTIPNTYATFEYNVSEWSGLDVTPVPDPAGATNNAASSTATTPTMSPTAGKEVLLMGVAFSNGTVTNSPSGGWTALNRSGSATSVGFGYLVVASASGSYSTTWANAPGYSRWATVAAGWDGAAAAAGGHPAGRRLGGVQGCRSVEIGRESAFIF